MKTRRHKAVIACAVSSDGGYRFAVEFPDADRDAWTRAFCQNPGVIGLFAGSADCLSYEAFCLRRAAGEPFSLLIFAEKHNRDGALLGYEQQQTRSVTGPATLPLALVRPQPALAYIVVVAETAAMSAAVVVATTDPRAFMKELVDNDRSGGADLLDHLAWARVYMASDYDFAETLNPEEYEWFERVMADPATPADTPHSMLGLIGIVSVEIAIKCTRNPGTVWNSLPPATVPLENVCHVIRVNTLPN